MNQSNSIRLEEEEKTRILRAVNRYIEYTNSAITMNSERNQNVQNNYQELHKKCEILAFDNVQFENINRDLTNQINELRQTNIELADKLYYYENLFGRKNPYSTANPQQKQQSRKQSQASYTFIPPLPPTPFPTTESPKKRVRIQEEQNVIVDIDYEKIEINGYFSKYYDIMSNFNTFPFFNQKNVSKEYIVIFLAGFLCENVDIKLEYVGGIYRILYKNTLLSNSHKLPEDVEIDIYRKIQEIKPKMTENREKICSIYDLLDVFLKKYENKPQLIRNFLSIFPQEFSEIIVSNTNNLLKELKGKSVLTNVFHYWLVKTLICLVD